MVVVQEAIRGNGFEPTQSPPALPIIEQFRQRIIGYETLRKHTVSLAQVLDDHKLIANRALFSCVYDEFDNSPAIIKIRNGQRRLYRVDPSLVPDLVTKIQEKFPESFPPPRTPEEMAQAQTKLLQVRASGGTHEYYSITLDEAFSRLKKRGFDFFHTMPDPSELVDRAIAAVVPYLSGERRDFADFATFERFFARVLKRKAIDWFRSSQRREITIDPQDPGKGVIFDIADHENTSSIDREQEDERLRELLYAKLPENDARLMERRLIEKLRYSDIAVIDEQERSVMALRQRVRRIKRQMRGNPPPSQPRIPTEYLVEEYTRFRNTFLQETGRLPSSNDFNRAKSTGRCKYGFFVYMERFGNNTWSKAQAELERLITQD